MAGLGERLRELDRKAGYGRQPTAEEWRRGIRRWRWLIAVAIAQVTTVVAALVFVAPISLSFAPVAFVALWLAFRAGKLKAEEDRLEGRGPRLADEPSARRQ